MAASTGYVYAHVDTAVFVDAPAHPGSQVTTFWRVQPVYQAGATSTTLDWQVALYGPFATRTALQAALQAGEVGPPQWRDVLTRGGEGLVGGTRSNSVSESTLTNVFTLPGTLTPGVYDLVAVLTVQSGPSQQVRADTPLAVVA
jgi:hypothetical protein